MIQNDSDSDDSGKATDSREVDMGQDKAKGCASFWNQGWGQMPGQESAAKNQRPKPHA